MANVTIFGDIADSYDAVVAYDEKFFDQWVESRGYSTASMITASGALALMQFAQTFTDIGRLGNGIFIEGGRKGVGKDAMRAINLIGNAGAVLGRAGTMFPVIQRAEGGLCFFTAQANALRLTGQRFFVTAEKLIQAIGADVDHVWQFGAFTEEYSKFFDWLRRARIPYNILLNELRGEERTFEALEKAIRAADDGVVTFGIGATGRAAEVQGIGKTEHLVHRLYATFSRTEGLIIRDPLGPTFRSFKELAAHFKDLRLLKNPVILIKNSVLVNASHLGYAIRLTPEYLRNI